MLLFDDLIMDRSKFDILYKLALIIMRKGIYKKNIQQNWLIRRPLNNETYLILA